MRRLGHLFEKIIAFDNLLHAAHQAARGKKEQPRVAHFIFYLETELLRLKEELRLDTWRPSGFRVFEIREPKVRRISAADFRDRVLHHALCNILEPVFDKRLIYDTWACRKGKGTHRAVKRTQYFCGNSAFFLKCDVKRYFDSIDHEVLKQLLRLIIKDKKLLSILDRIIEHPVPGIKKGKGLPIGNLTSQYFANQYLGILDHEIKDRLGVKKYLRYMDDMLVFADNKKQLHDILGRIKGFLKCHLQLNLKSSVTRIAPVTEGVPFLGFQIFPGLIRLNGHSLRRFRRRWMSLEKKYELGEIDIGQVNGSVQSMIAHLKHGDTLRLRQSLLASSLTLG